MIENTLDNFFDEHIKHKLNEKMEHILKIYTDERNEDFSDYFFNRRQIDDIERESIAKDIKILRKTIKLSKMPFPLTVYHGTSKRIIHGKESIRVKTFLSTSLSSSVAHDFAGDYGNRGLIIQINIPAGYPALWMGPISLYPIEEEILLLNNIKLKIIDHSQFDENIEKIITRPVL